MHALKKNKLLAFIFLIIIVIMLPVISILVRQRQQKNQHAAGEQTAVYLAQQGSTTPLTSLTVPQGQSVSLELYLNTNNINISGFDITIGGGNNMTISQFTPGPDAAKFNVPIYSTINPQTNSFRYTEVTKDTTAVITGLLHLGTITFTPGNVGTGFITIPVGIITSTSSPTALTVAHASLADIVIGIPTPPIGCRYQSICPTCMPGTPCPQFVCRFQLVCPSNTPVPPTSAPSARPTVPPPPPQSGSIYYGVWTNHDDFSLVPSFEQDAGKKVSLFAYNQKWQQLTGGMNAFNTTLMDSIRNHGSIPLVTWASEQECIPTNFYDNHCQTQPNFSLSNINNGTFDAYITQWALAAKAWGHPFFLRFDFDINYNTNPWNEQTNGNNAGQFVTMWKHVHDIFTNNGVTNVTWVWTPAQEYNGSTPFSQLYPGDTYVDWVGTNAYNVPPGSTGPSYQTFSQIITQTYNDLQAIAPSKPIMIAEMGSPEVPAPNSKAAWITDAVTVQIPNNFPKIKAFLWVNVNDTPPYDFRIESSPAAQQAFASAVASSVYTSNQYACISTSPILPPNQMPIGVCTPTAQPTNTPPTPTPTPITYLPADVNRNGCVNIIDFNDWLQAFTGNPVPNTFPDIDGDGTVDIVDFNIWLRTITSLYQNKPNDPRLCSN